MSEAATHTAHTQAIFALIQQDDTEGIARLLDADPMLVHARRRPESSSLDNLLLLEHGADPTAHEINWIGGTPLHWASERHPEIVQLLIDAGADVNARVVRPGSSHLGGTPLHWCARQKDDCAEVVKVLLKNGSDPALTDAFGKTALQYAEADGHAQVAEALRSHKA